MLLPMGPPCGRYDSGYGMGVARELEKIFPDKILAYYRSGLGDLNANLPRKEYAAKAAVMEKVRHMYVDILKAPGDWEAFARQVKGDNVRRPAFQEEFARIVSGWRDLK
jgi:hypothetical protein